MTVKVTVKDAKLKTDDWSLADIEAAFARVRKAKRRDDLFAAANELVDALFQLHEDARDVVDDLINAGAG